MHLFIHVIADLTVPEATPTTLQIEAADFAGAQTIEEYDADDHAVCGRRAVLGLLRQPLPAASDAGRRCSGGIHSNGAQPDTRFPLLKPYEADALHLPTETLLYTLPSRYCQSDRLVAMASDLFGEVAPGFARVQTICNWINEHITYQYGVSDAGTSAYDTATQRIGVCRDFAHLGIAFCRALNIPARYVSGYCLGLDPPDFHAYFQAFLDGRWVSFDATERQPRPALVQIAVGRDAADCAWSTFYGYGETKVAVR